MTSPNGTWHTVLGRMTALQRCAGRAETRPQSSGTEGRRELRIALVENMAETPLGLVGQALDEARAEVMIYRPFVDGRIPALDDHDGLIVMGGEQNALDDAAHPYLPDLARRMLDFGAADRAVLGICLGSQLLARAHGGENHVGGHREFGWVEIEATPDGINDPFLSAAGRSFEAFQWHDDSFALPPQAVHLARSVRVAHQAYRIGRASYGTQFHFEVNGALVDRWAETLPRSMDAMHPTWRENRAAHIAASAARADASGLALARAWLSLV